MLVNRAIARHFRRVQDKDRYVMRPTGNPDRWCVWDTHRDAVVYGAKNLSERQAREMVERLNDAYRRSKQ
jgi:hypothetical protein